MAVIKPVILARGIADPCPPFPGALFIAISKVFELLATKDHLVIGIKQIDAPLKRRGDFSRIKDLNQCAVILVLTKAAYRLFCFFGQIGKFKKVAQNEYRMLSSGMNVCGLPRDTFRGCQHRVGKLFKMFCRCDPRAFTIKGPDGFAIPDQKIGQRDGDDQYAFSF